MLGAVAQAQVRVRVEGPPDAVHVEARDVPLRKVLDELQAKFNLRYRADDGLDTAVTGNFHGSLRRVVVRVLDGYDFVMKIGPEGIDVLVVRPNQLYDRAVSGAMPAVSA